MEQWAETMEDKNQKSHFKIIFWGTSGLSGLQVGEYLEHAHLIMQGSADLFGFEIAIGQLIHCSGYQLKGQIYITQYC